MIPKILNDRQLVIKIKQNRKTEDYEVLYKRYLPMIRKYAFKVGRNFRGHNFEIQQDFEQEAYFVLVKTVHKIDISKIKNDNWKFQGIFYFHLRNLLGKSLKQLFNQMYTQVSIQQIEDCLSSIDTNNNQLVKKTLKKLSVSIQHYLDFNEIRDIIIDKFTPRQKEIIQYRQSNMTLSEIGKKLDISHPAVHWDLKRAKKIANKIIDEQLILR